MIIRSTIKILGKKTEFSIRMKLKEEVVELNQFQICNNSESHKQVFLCISQSKSFIVFKKTM